MKITFLIRRLYFNENILNNSRQHLNKNNLEIAEGIPLDTQKDFQ